MRYASLRERFDAKVRRSAECWTWTAYTNRKGYGEISSEGRNRLAHRIAWELANGPIPDGMDVLHQCDNPPCVRPDHLFLGTDVENNADMRRKGRAVYHNTLKTHCKHGHPLDRTAKAPGGSGKRRVCGVCQGEARRAHYRRHPKKGVAPSTRTHCPRGHLYDAENTYLYRGHRQCLTCRRECTRQRNQKRGKKAA